MFKVRRKHQEEIYQVLDVYMDETTGATFFFLWENGGWRWRPAESFVPPNWKEDRNNK